MVGVPPPSGGGAGTLSGYAAQSGGGLSSSPEASLHPPVGSRHPWSADQLALLGLASSPQPPLARPSGPDADPYMQAESYARGLFPSRGGCPAPTADPPSVN